MWFHLPSQVVGVRECFGDVVVVVDYGGCAIDHIGEVNTLCAPVDDAVHVGTAHYLVLSKVLFVCYDI